MAGSLDQLYQHIVQAFALKDDLIDIDLNANASESGGDLSGAKQEALEREKAVSSQLEPYFRSGIAKAQAAGNGEIALSDQDPIQNKEADALIRYLVSFGLAPSLVMYNWSLSSLRDYGHVWGKIGWAAAFLYAA